VLSTVAEKSSMDTWRKARGLRTTRTTMSSTMEATVSPDRSPAVIHVSVATGSKSWALRIRTGRAWT
jgi:hypothetical protein